MTQYGFRLFMPLLYLLVACSPSVTQSPSAPVLSGSQPQATVQLASEQRETAPQSETERFPSKVTTTPLDSPIPDTVAAVEEAIKELEELAQQDAISQPGSGSGSGAGSASGRSGSSLGQPGLHVLSFSTRGGSQQVHIPASGRFRLMLQAGEHFAILDDDARDGMAHVQLPAGNFETLLRLQGSGTLQVEDHLYHIKDTIQGNDWKRLGIRPLPVPTVWYEPDGQFVLHFIATQVQDFQLSWQLQNNAAEPPPGLREIGPAGGVVELPGVATLEIPAGALGQPTLVRLRQQMEATSQRVYCPNPHIPDECYDGWVFASPIVRIDPLELELNQPAQLDLPIYEFFEKYPPVSIDSRAIDSPFRQPTWTGGGYIALNPQIKKLSDKNRHNIPVWIKRFGFFARQINYYSSMDEFLQPFQTMQSQIDACASNGQAQVYISEHFYIVDGNGDVCPEALTHVEAYLEKAYEIFKGWGLRVPPPKFDEEFSFDEHKIPVTLKSRLSTAHTQEAAGIARPNYDQSGAYTHSEIELKVSDGLLSGPNYFSQFAADTAIHELFHVFQQAYQSHRSHNPAMVDRWLTEGTARLVGAYVAQTHAQALGLVGLHFPKPQDFNYSQDLATSLNWTHKSLYLSRNYNEPTVYQTAHFWAHLSQRFGGVPVLAEVIAEYGENHQIKQGDTPRSTAALNAWLRNKSTSLTEYFSDFGEAVLTQTDINLFPEVTVPPVPYVQTHLLKAENNQLNPLKITVSNPEPLASQYILLQPDSALDGPRQLMLRRVEPSSDRTLQINGQSHQTGDFLQTALVALNNAEGKVFTRNLENGQFQHHMTSQFWRSENGSAGLPDFGGKAGAAVLILNNGLWAYDTWNVIQQQRFQTVFEAFLLEAPEVMNSRALSMNEDPTQTRFVLTVKGVDCNLSPCQVSMEMAQGARAVVPIESVLSEQQSPDGQVIQQMVVKAHNHARVGGNVFISQNGLKSSLFEDAIYVCNMLSDNSSCPASESQNFCLKANRPVPQKLRPCQQT